MVYQNTPVTRWGSTKIAIIMETILLTLSIPMIALAAISGVQLGHAYLYHVGPDRLMNIGGVGPETHLVPIPDLSVPRIVFLYGTMPALTLLASAAGLTLRRCRNLGGLYGVSISVIMLAGWVVTTYLWFSCDLGFLVNLLMGGSTPRYCYQRHISHNNTGWYNGMTTGVWMAKLAFCGLIDLTYLVFFALSAFFVYRESVDKRRERERAHTIAKNLWL